MRFQIRRVENKVITTEITTVTEISMTNTISIGFQSIQSRQANDLCLKVFLKITLIHDFDQTVASNACSFDGWKV